MNEDSSRQSPGNGRRVLVVDDSPVSRKFVERRLAQLGYDVSAAENGRRALESARVTLPDAIVTDLHMPELDGFGLCRAIRADSAFAAVAVIITSASDITESEKRSALDAGAAAIVTRTMVLHEIIAALRDIGEVSPLN